MFKQIVNILHTLSGTRDVDSLEMTLVTTLVEHFDGRKATLYRINDAQCEHALTLYQDEDGQYELDVHCRTADDTQLVHYLSTTEQPVFIQRGDAGWQIIVPLHSDQKPVGGIDLHCEHDLSGYANELSIFSEIYRNYLEILTASEQDTLTGLFNRQTFDVKFERLVTRQRAHYERAKEQSLAAVGREHSRSYRLDQHLWLAMIDIDHFKSVNDQYGHVCGDEVLLAMANLMRKSFRYEDLLFRFGGEEFVVVLAPTAEQEVFAILDRFRRNVAEQSFPLVDKVTVSIGYEKITEKDYPMQVAEKADKALYYVKKHGRNSVRNYQALVAEQAITEVRADQSNDIDLF
ncbi:GGDEF domain-containing protein [Reinekea sp. G2M2-21]|uniref:GGDEF domain-containing protein n=1 Tax=Reinekea sp. G2M2-21 TaxID=2788942 RepID=UPI0018AA9C2E|nr:GGDEF domain-containing protein [Reinekea sp. G2M2-21]